MQHCMRHYVIFHDGDLPKSTTGAILIPLGFLTIQETEAPFGYLINDTMYVCHVMQDKDTVRTSNLPTGGNAVREQSSLTEISVSKTVTGNAGNKNEEFSFKLSLSNNNDPSIVINNSYWVFYEEEGKETQNACSNDCSGNR